MPVFYFDSDDGSTKLADAFGVVLADVWEARAMAITLLPDMARDALPDGDDQHDFSATVRTVDGKIIYHATLSLRGTWID